MSASDTITIVLVMVLSVSFIFMLAQVSMKEINPDGPAFYDCSQSPLGYAIGDSCDDSTSYTLRQYGDNDLPSANAQTSPSTGNIFTDTFSAGKNWVLHSTGVGYVIDILSAPSYFLKAIGLPPVVSYGIAGIFYMVLLFLIASWLLGR